MNGLPVRLRERASAFNDAGLRYGVADLLTEAAKTIEDVTRLLESLPIQSAESAKEPWAKFHLIDITKAVDVAKGEDDPATWISEYCGKTFGHTAHHWSDYEDGRKPLRIAHYCDGIES